MTRFGSIGSVRQLGWNMCLDVINGLEMMR